MSIGRRKIVIRDGGASIEMSTDMHAEVKAAANEIGRRMIEVMERERDLIYDTAQANWRSRSGRSKAAMRKYLRVNPMNGEIRVGIDFPGISYTYYIREIGLGKFRFVTFVRTPMKRAAGRIATKIARAGKEALNEALPSGKR